MQKISRKSDVITSYLMMALPVLTIVIFVVLPFLWVLYYSFFDYNGISPEKFVGFLNYKKIFTSSPQFWLALSNSFIFTGVKLIFEISISLILAYALTDKLKGKRFFRLVIFMPFVFSTAVIGVVFSGFFNHQTGFVNTVLQYFGFEPIMWFSDRMTALITIMVASVWQNIGINMMYFITGIVSINTEVYDAAKIDGASYLQRFFKVMLPILRPTFIIILINAILGSLKETDIFLTLTGGSPVGRSESVMTYIYKLFFGEEGSGVNFGQPTSMAVMVSLIFSVLAAVYLYFSFGKKKDKEGLL